jgi:hypothetical protein
MEEEEIKIIVRWPGNRCVFLKVLATATPKIVVDLCYEPGKLSVYPYFIHNQKLLDLDLSFKYQGVKDGDTIFIYEHKTKRRRPIRANPGEDLEMKVYEVMQEVLAIRDRFHRIFESTRRATIAYETFIECEEASMEFCLPPPEETVLADSTCIRDDPLPPIIDPDSGSEDRESMEDSPNFPAFESVEQAGKFFSKHPKGEWTW